MESKKQLINDFFDRYKDDTVTFNQQVTAKTGLLKEEVWIKCQGRQNSAVLFAASMANAKLMLKLPIDWFTLINKAEKKITLHMAFNDPSGKGYAAFIIDSKITEFSKFHGASDDLYMITAEYRKKAPDDLIEILGLFISSQKSLEKRIFQRIRLNPEISTKAGLLPADTVLFCEGKARRCILNELSILSAQVLIEGRKEDYEKKRVLLLIKTEPNKELGEMVGDVLACDKMDGRHSLLSVIVKFDQDLIPPTYKMFIGEFLEKYAKK